jgi:hypothetical protein
MNESNHQLRTYVKQHGDSVGQVSSVGVINGGRMRVITVRHVRNPLLVARMKQDLAMN